MDRENMVVTEDLVVRHFKNTWYIIVCEATSEATGEVCVVYKQLYGNNKVWIRPKEEFFSEVDHTKYPEVSQQYRFMTAEEIMENPSENPMYKIRLKNIMYSLNNRTAGRLALAFRELESGSSMSNAF